VKRNASKGSDKARVFVVDDHPVVRRGVVDLINEESDLAVCGEAGGVAEALEALKELEPDVAVVDLVLRDGSGLDLIKDIKTRHPEVAILVLSMRDPAVYAERALQGGAQGYVTKGDGTRRLVDGIRHVLEGKVYLDESMAQSILGRLAGVTPPKGRPATRALTDRELEVLRLTGQGLSIDEIAERLHRSPKTVETHRENIKLKLGLDSARDVLKYAIRWMCSEDV
jgi:DNA-binding NarL/FixJ family response regulator